MLVITRDFIRHVRTPAGVRYYHEPIGSPIGKHVMRSFLDKAKEITKADLSNPDTPRTRAVSSEEFSKLYTEGRKRLDEFFADRSEPKGLDARAEQIAARAYEATRQEWGGATFDAHTGQEITGNAEKYAMTVKTGGKEPVSLPLDADQNAFSEALAEARKRFSKELSSKNASIGVFRDEDNNRIDLDPVLVVDNLHDVDTIGSYTRAVGGAYGFHDGNGYWPPYVKEGG